MEKKKRKRYLHLNPEIPGGKASDGVDIFMVQVWFVPAVTIECNPPYIKGKSDCCWTRRRADTPIDVYNKKKSESIVGMKLLPYEELLSADAVQG